RRLRNVFVRPSRITGARLKNNRRSRRPEAPTVDSVQLSQAASRWMAFAILFLWLLVHNGLEDACIYTRSKRELPGYFRATKDWDLVAVHQNHLVAAIEFKSQRGPSFGNNVNIRVEAALGNATVLWTDFREGAYGIDRPRP